MVKNNHNSKHGKDKDNLDFGIQNHKGGFAVSSYNKDGTNKGKGGENSP
jgi:hypothetical protein